MTKIVEKIKCKLGKHDFEQIKYDKLPIKYKKEIDKFPRNEVCVITVVKCKRCGITKTKTIPHDIIVFEKCGTGFSSGLIVIGCKRCDPLVDLYRE